MLTFALLHFFEKVGVEAETGLLDPGEAPALRLDGGLDCSAAFGAKPFDDKRLGIFRFDEFINSSLLDEFAPVKNGHPITEPLDLSE